MMHQLSTRRSRLIPGGDAHVFTSKVCSPNGSDTCHPIIRKRNSPARQSARRRDNQSPVCLEPLMLNHQVPFRYVKVEAHHLDHFGSINGD